MSLRCDQPYHELIVQVLLQYDYQNLKYILHGEGGGGGAMSLVHNAT